MERRLAAIMAADVVGYSKLMAADEVGTLATLKAHRADLFDPLVARHNGRIVKLMGDGVLVEFASAVDAVDCADAVQRALAESDGPVKLRIGINLGDVMIDDDDVYGDGVNVAARLEALAKPGGICISNMVYQNVHTKTDAVFVDIGEQNLKNIDRPIAVWRWQSGGQNAVRHAQGEASDRGVRPSIAVLPFNNMSGDPDQEYFSDGITEDIITELSRFRELFVIARNSSFFYKNKLQKVTDIGRDLGVAYIVEGSVRRAGSRVRVTAQLIDSETGKHIWAERYDRELKDIFDLQDEITQTIVAVLPAKLQGALVEAVRSRASEDLSAYDRYLHGRWLYDQSTGQDPKALQLLSDAIEIDPACAHAHAYIALAHSYSLYTINPIGEDPTGAAVASVERALATGKDDHFIHATAGTVYILAGMHDLADLHSMKGASLNPNDIIAMLSRGYVLSYLGNPAAGVEQMTNALRYDPQTPYHYYEQCAEACYMLGDYRRAVEIYKSWQSPPAHMYVPLAANYAQLGQMDAARDAMVIFESFRPKDTRFTFYASTHARMCKQPEDAEHWLDGYRKIGLIE